MSKKRLRKDFSLMKETNGFCLKLQNKCIYCDKNVDTNLCNYENEFNKKYVNCENYINEFKSLLGKIKDIEILLELEKQTDKEKGKEVETIFESFFFNRNRDSSFEYMLYNIRKRIFEIKKEP